jgi:hypothetical protein
LEVPGTRWIGLILLGAGAGRPCHAVFDRERWGQENWLFDRLPVLYFDQGFLTDLGLTDRLV